MQEHRFKKQATESNRQFLIKQIEQNYSDSDKNDDDSEIVVISPLDHQEYNKNL